MDIYIKLVRNKCKLSGIELENYVLRKEVIIKNICYYRKEFIKNKVYNILWKI